MPPPYTQHEVMQYLIGPRDILVSDTEFARNNENMVTEQNMLRDGKFVYARHTERIQLIGADHKFFVQLESSSGIAQRKAVKLDDTKYWYRAMNREDFRYLKKNYAVRIDDSYGGICSHAEYSLEYMGWQKTHDYLIQFTCHGDANFKASLEEKRVEKGKPLAYPKAEAETGTYGLGKTGHYQGLAGEVFNDLMNERMITWDLVYVYIRAK